MRVLQIKKRRKTKQKTKSKTNKKHEKRNDDNMKRFSRKSQDF